MINLAQLLQLMAMNNRGFAGNGPGGAAPMPTANIPPQGSMLARLLSSFPPAGVNPAQNNPFSPLNIFIAQQKAQMAQQQHQQGGFEPKGRN